MDSQSEKPAADPKGEFTVFPSAIYIFTMQPINGLRPLSCRLTAYKYYNFYVAAGLN